MQALAATLLFASPVSAADSLSAPTAVVQQLLDAIRQYKDEKSSPLSAADRRRNETAKKLANAALAIREVSQQALGAQWDKLPPSERTAFVKLVTDLFERVAYPKSAGFFGDLTIEFKGEQISGRSALVHTVVRHPKEGLVAIDYKLDNSHGRWVVRDIILDEVSLAVDLRSQIQKVLREESYPRLLQRMRDKLKEG